MIANYNYITQNITQYNGSCMAELIIADQERVRFPFAFKLSVNFNILKKDMRSIGYLHQAVSETLG